MRRAPWCKRCSHRHERGARCHVAGACSSCEAPATRRLPMSDVETRMHPETMQVLGRRVVKTTRLFCDSCGPSPAELAAAARRRK